MLFAKNESSTEVHTNLPVELGPEADALLEKKMLWAKERQAEAEQLALDAARLLSCTEDQFTKLSKQGFFKRCWNAFTGENASIERANTANLLQMQQMSLRYINMLQEQQIMTAHSLLALRNNLLTLSTKQEETQQLIIGLAEKTLARFEALENRVDQMEITQNLQGWLLTLEDRDYDEKFPTPYLRLMRVINDYFSYKKDRWNYNDVLFLRKALRTVGLDPKLKISMEAFVDTLIGEITEQGFDIYNNLLLAHVPDGLNDPCQYALDNISSQVVIAVNGVYIQYHDKIEIVETLSENLNCSLEEAFKKLIKSSIEKLNVNMRQTIALGDIAAELLMGLSLEYRLGSSSTGQNINNDNISHSDKEDEESFQNNETEESNEKEDKDEYRYQKVFSFIHECFGDIAIQENSSLYVKGYYCSSSVTKKVKNGINSFGFLTDFDDVLVYYDSTLFGGGDEGVILTKDMIYYKNSFSDPWFYDYSLIDGVQKNWSNYELDFTIEKISMSCAEDVIKDAFVRFFNKIILLYSE